MKAGGGWDMDFTVYCNGVQITDYTVRLSETADSAIKNENGSFTLKALTKGTSKLYIEYAGEEFEFTYIVG